MIRFRSERMLRRRSHSICTPEGITFSFPLAGVFARFFAVIIDMVVVALVSSSVSSILMVAQIVSSDLAAALVTVQGFVLAVGYPMVMEWGWRGQTVGKRILRIRVMDEDGLKLKFSQVFIRNILRFADMLPAFYMLGGLAAVLTARCQRFGDLAAGTIVVAVPLAESRDVSGVMAGKFNTFRAYPHIAARLRQAVSPVEAAIALDAVLRREELLPEARVSLFAEFRDHFAAKAAFPDEATHGLSDEQYVRNVVDLLNR